MEIGSKKIIIIFVPVFRLRSFQKMKEACILTVIMT